MIGKKTQVPKHERLALLDDPSRDTGVCPVPEIEEGLPLLNVMATADQMGTFPREGGTNNQTQPFLDALGVYRAAKHECEENARGLDGS